ncbi:MAG TPA: hypothetical protein VFO44_09540 [Steroidobacteraceae bacterium]|nr:hypothetical protein [Steroidobacteraceae bacterium]
MNRNRVAMLAGFFCALLTICSAVAVAQVDPQSYSGMRWRQIGPFRGGRVVAVSGVPGDPATWYFGGVAGGVWKSTNAGDTWHPVFDGQKIASIGAIAVADSNHDVLYVGTGEACPRGNITYGDGVYKSLDAGKTWEHVGLTDTRHIGAIVIDPHNPDVVLVAALGHAFGPNEQRGVFRTADGGKTWQRVLYRDHDTGAIDVALDPHDPNIVFAALWQMRRQPWSFSSGGPGSGLYRSADGGLTWKQIQGHGLPDGPLGRIAVSVSGADSQRVYASVEAKEGGIFRSDDGGANWTRINEDHRFRQRAWYFSHIFADPVTRDTVYVLNTGAFRSTNGGKDFQLLPAPHGDHHALWIDPRDPRRLINGNDGGATISVDAGATWTQQNNQPTAQFYHVAVDNHWPYRVYGAQQDNSTVAIASRDDDGVIGRQDWYEVGGGESGYIAPDPRNADIVYANSDSGQMTRYDHHTDNFRDVSMHPLDVSGNAAAGLEYRIQWTEPVFVSPHDSNVLYTAAQFVLKSEDQGKSWKRISDDLTRNDKSKQQASGGPITLDITSVEYYDTVFTLAESSLVQGMLWAGTDDGLIHVTADDGKHWRNVTPKDMPAWSTVSMIEPSPHDAKTAFAAVDRHRLDDLSPIIYRTHDGGVTWQRIVTGIPTGSFVRAVREDPQRRGLLYAATELGVYVSFDDGEHWQPLQLNLPVAPVHDLVIKGDDLVAATHGRSFWILDDLTPLRQIEVGAALPPVRLYRPEAAYRLHFPIEVNRRRPVGDNPPNGAIIDYYLKEKARPDEEIALDILDSQGRVLRHYSNHRREKFEQPAEWPDREKPAELLPDEAGMNRFAWDLRMEDPVQIPGAFYADEGPKGPVVNPGDYTVRLTTLQGTQSVPLQVVPDPRIQRAVTAADVAAHWDLVSKTAADVEALHTAVNQIRATRQELQKRQDGTSGESGKHSLSRTESELEKKMAPIEEQLIQVNMKASEDNLRYPNRLDEQYDTFIATVDNDDFRPTEPQLQVFSQLHTRLQEELGKWKSLQDTDLPKLNSRLKEAGAAPLAVSGAAPGT